MTKNRIASTSQGGASVAGQSELIPPIKPISLLMTLLLFGVPFVIFSLSVLVLLPSLVRRGLSPFAVVNLTFNPPLALLLIASFVGLKLEGRTLTWPVIRDRFRLGRLPRHGWLWVLGLCFFDFAVGAFVSSWLSHPPAELRIFTWPKELTDFIGAMYSPGKEFLGITLRGQWWLPFYWTANLVVFNIFGEELWWRGYILPRQELAHGRWAWLIHGILWDLFHGFYHQTVWSFLAFLPITLSISYVAQRLKSTWPGIIAHTLTNSVILVPIVRGILG
jgi:membrane protease YdiL (CAAX protease family)